MFVSRAHILEVFFTKLVFNLKSEASKTYLSYAWWLLEPALLVAVFYIVGKGNEDFVVFLVCGAIPFAWFDKSITNSAGSIIGGYGLINQASVPKALFPMLVVFQDAFKQSVVFVCMFAFLVANGMEVNWTTATVFAVILSQLLFVCAFALVVASITPFLPDFKLLISSLMLALMFGSGVFYSYLDVLKPEHRAFFLMNQVLMENTAPDWTALGYICLFSAAVILIMNRYFKKRDTIYARLITQ
jgi:lipopolysaccharide transport system permease protein